VLQQIGLMSFGDNRFDFAMSQSEFETLKDDWRTPASRSYAFEVDRPAADETQQYLAGRLDTIATLVEQLPALHATQAGESRDAALRAQCLAIREGYEAYKALAALLAKADIDAIDTLAFRDRYIEEVRVERERREAAKDALGWASVIPVVGMVPGAAQAWMHFRDGEYISGTMAAVGAVLQGSSVVKGLGSAGRLVAAAPEASAVRSIAAAESRSGLTVANEAQMMKAGGQAGATVMREVMASLKPGVPKTVAPELEAALVKLDAAADRAKVTEQLLGTGGWGAGAESVRSCNPSAP
jgi:hypothetical protein